MKKKVLVKHLLLLFFMTTLISSCIDKDYDLENISEDMALNNMVLQSPVGKVDATLQQILERANIGEVIVNGDSMYLLYKDTLHLVPNNPVSIITPMSADFFAPAIGTQFILDTDLSFNLSPLATRIDSATLVDSRIRIDVNSSLTTNAQFTLVLPTGLELQTPSEGIFTVSPGLTTKYLDVKDNSIIRIENNPTPSIPIQYILDTPSSETIGVGDVGVNFVFDVFKTEIFWGFLGDVVYDEQANQITLNFFRDIVPEGSRLYFTDPKVTCRAINYVGMSSVFNVNYVTASSEDGLETVSADFSGNPDYNFPLNAATVPYQPTITTEVFDRVKGGTNQLFLINPSYLSYSFTNVPNIIPGQNHFLVRDKYVDVILEAKLEFDFDEGTFLLTNDTMDLDLTDQETIEDVKRLEVRITYENALPANIAVDAIFLDENYLPIPSLEKLFDVASAPINTEGYAIGETKDLFYINFKESDFPDVVKVKYILMKSQTKPLNDASKMKFRSTDYINVKADLYVVGDIKF